MAASPAGGVGPVIFGAPWRYFARSQRVSNERLKALAGWAPTIKGVAEGWPFIASQLAAKVA